MNTRLQQLATLPAFLLAAPALAHPGHMTEAAGHSHWLGLAALGGALFVAILAFAGYRIRRRRAALHG